MATRPIALSGRSDADSIAFRQVLENLLGERLLELQAYIPQIPRAPIDVDLVLTLAADGGRRTREEAVLLLTALVSRAAIEAGASPAVAT